MTKTRCYQAVLDAGFGKIGVLADCGGISEVDFLASDPPLIQGKSQLLQQFQTQLKAYLEHPEDLVFDVAVQIKGTDFQRRVWSALRQIPSGSTLTYSQLAEQLGTGARAVGNACRANPLPLIVPCHRVVSARGLGGFGGDAEGGRTAIKRWLLRHEGASILP
jgi:methylated-DNA-[protein]-cysteine S-methyltransferase